MRGIVTILVQSSERREFVTFASFRRRYRLGAYSPALRAYGTRTGLLYFGALSPSTRAPHDYLYIDRRTKET